MSTKNLIISILILFNCSKCTPPTDSGNISAFDQFDSYFTTIIPHDTLVISTINWEYEDSTHVIPDSLFFGIVDTTILNNKNWDERQIAVGKWTISDSIIAYFTARHFVNHDQSILMLLYDTQQKAFVADFTIEEFIGYEGYVYQRGAWLLNQQEQPKQLVMVEHFHTATPDGIVKDSIAEQLYLWDKQTFWQVADSSILELFDFSSFEIE